MKKLTSFFISLIVLLLSADICLLAQINKGNTLQWTETLVKDFSDSKLNNLVIKNQAGGEVQLAHPFRKLTADYQDNSYPFYASRNKRDEYLKTWLQGRDIYVQKFSKDGLPLTNPIRVNDTLGIGGNDTQIRTAFMDNSTYIVLFVPNGYHPTKTDDNMYGQLFTSDSIRSGNNFLINDHPNYSSRIPMAIYNPEDHLFWIFYDRYDSGTYRIFYQKRNLQGGREGQEYILNPIGSSSNYESDPWAAICGDKIAVTWEGSSVIKYTTSNQIDIFARWYTLKGEPVNQVCRINSDTSREVSRMSPHICADEKGNTVLVWNEISASGTIGKLFGQLFDANANKMREIFSLSNSSFPYYLPNVEYFDNTFLISYSRYAQSGNETYLSKWRLDNLLSGEMTSSTFDIGPRGSRFDKILWDGLFGLNTSVKFQLRSSTDTLLLKNSKWYGPTDTLSYYSTDEGQQINQIHNGDRFIQYRAFFNTSSINITPVLNSVSIGYIPNDTLAPASPQNFTSKAEHSSIKLSWTPNSESDLARYIIYKGTESKNYIPQWTVEVPASISSYKDTLVVTGKTYYYCIIALDSAWNMSSSAKEISGTPAAINIYVSYKGNDLNDGSENTPFLTISKAIAAAKYGDNVMVLPGLYNEVITMKKGVSLTGAGAQYTKILQTTPNSYGIYGASDASLTGFTIEVNKQDSYAAINTNNSSLKIFDNRIIYTGSIGTYAPGIQTRDTSNSEICRNFIDGFTVGILAHSLAHQKIRNNIIRAAQVGIEIPGYISSEITNNTIIGPRVRGIYFDNPQTVVKNNIIYGLDSTFTVGINTGSFNQGYDVSYNDVWNCRTKYNLNTPGTGNLVKDPLFINPDTQNFGLMAGSPCIDTGDPASAFNDIDGSRNDMGAYGGPDPIKSNVFLELVKAISVSKVSAFPGDTLSIALKMDNLSGILKGTFTLKFNSGTLTYLDASKTKATENFDLKASLVGDNLNICLTGNKAIESINKDLIIFRFVASKNAAGLTSPISVINASFMDNALNSIYIKSISDGLVSVGNVSNSKNAIYVGISPNSKEDGSYINPYSSIQRAIDNAKYGDTVYVAGGEYTENLKMKEGVSVIGSGAVLTTLIQKQNARAVDFINISKGELSGFTIKGNEYDPSINALVMMSNSSACFFRNVIDCREHPSMGIWIDDHSIPRIENNSFMSAGTTIRKSAPIIKNNHMLLEGALESNIFISDSSTPSIIANKIRVSQSSLNVGNASAIIKNNRITILNGPECIMLNRSNNVTIQNNIIEDQGDGAKAIWIFDSQNLSVINNTITSKAAGIQESGSTGSIMNNIITGSLLNGVSLSTSAMLQYNNVWGNKTNYFNISAGATDIQADPVFTGSNYMLSSTSPCINAGNPATEYNDKDGSRNDIGAYGGPEADLSWVNIKNDCRLQIDSVEAAPNDTVHLKMNAYSVKNTSDLDFTISYDTDALTFLGATPSTLTPGFSMLKSSVSLNSVQIKLTGSRPISQNDGPVTEIFFQVRKSGKEKCTIKFEGANIIDNINNPFSISELIDGKIVINPTGINDDKKVPISFYLENNYPNPFNPSTTIEYGIQKASHVKLKIFDVLGREITTLVDKEQNSGQYKVLFNAFTLPSGVYIYRLEAGNFRSSKKLLLIK